MNELDMTSPPGSHRGYILALHFPGNFKYWAMQLHLVETFQGIILGLHWYLMLV